MALLSINILNYNTYEKSVVCIDSCLRQKSSKYRILLIDNASTDDSLKKLQSKYGDTIEYYQTGDNYGYAGGNNRGILKSRSDGYKYTLMLNSDTELEGENLVENLLNIIESHKDCGIVAPLIYDVTAEGLQKISNDSLYVKILRLFKVLPTNEVISNVLETKSEAHGSALLVDNDIFLECQGFPEHFFMYAEESVLSKKMIWNGRRIYWLNDPLLFVKHHHDTSKSVEPWRLYLMGRNASLEYLENRNFKPGLWALAFFVFSFRSFICSFWGSKYHFKGIVDGIWLYHKGYSKEYILNHGKQAKVLIK